MPKVHLPDGRIVHFPYDMAPADIEREVATLVGDSPAPAAELSTPGVSERFDEGMRWLASKVPSSVPVIGPAVHTMAMLGRERALDSAPAIGGAVGGLTAGIPGAAVGGAAGSAFARLVRGQSLDPTAIATDAAIEGGGQAAGLGLARAANVAGRGLYRLALAPSKKLLQSFPDVVETGIREGVNVTPRGAAQAEALRQAAAREARGLVTQASSPAVRIPTRELLRGVDDLAVKSAAEPEANVTQEALRRFSDNVTASHPRGFSLEELLDTKQAAQRNASTAYRALEQGNRQAGLEAEANRALASRARQILEHFVPESAAANQRTQSLIGLERALEDAALRSGMMRHLILPTLTGTAAGGVTGDAGTGVSTAVTASLAGSPRVLGRAGLLLGRTGQQVPANLIRAAILDQLHQQQGPPASGPY